MDLISEFKGPFRAVAEHPTDAIGAQVTFRLGHEPGQKQARIVSLTVGICGVFGRVGCLFGEGHFGEESDPAIDMVAIR